MSDATERPRVLVFYDYACPFCYVDRPRFERLAREHDADLHLVPFELRPSLPQGGATVEELGAEHSPHVEEHLHRLAAEESLPYHTPARVPNTHLALSLGELARDAGPEMHADTHAAIFRAYLGERLDIGERGVLLGVARAVGLDPEQLRAVWDAGNYDARLAAYRDFGMGMGVRVTPTALVCNELLIGTRPYAVLEAAVRDCFEEAVSTSDGRVAEVQGSLAE